MRIVPTRLRPGLFFASLLALLSLGGCPAPVPAAPQSTEAAPKAPRRQDANTQRPTPNAQPFQTWLYTHEPQMEQLPAGRDWKACGVDVLIVGTQVMSNYRIPPAYLRAHIDNQLAAIGSAPWVLTLSSTAHTSAGQDMTFGGWDEARWRDIILPNIQDLAAYCRDKGCIGYLVDTECYGAPPHQIPGLAWPDAPPGVVELRAAQWIDALQAGHPGALVGLHGFHSYEWPFKSYRRWVAAFGQRVQQLRLRGLFLEEDGYNNAFSWWARSAYLAKLRRLYRMDVWVMGYAPSAGTAATLSTFYGNLLRAAPKLSRRSAGIAWYQNDDLWTYSPDQAAAFERAAIELRSLTGR